MATEEQARSPGSPRRDTAVAPLASSCCPRQRSFPSEPTGSPLCPGRGPPSPTEGVLPVGAARMAARAAGMLPHRGGGVDTGRGGTRKRCGAGVSSPRAQRGKGQLSPKRVFQATGGQRPLGWGGSEAAVAAAGCPPSLAGGEDRGPGRPRSRGGGSSPATISLPSDQIFIRAGHGKGFAWGQPAAGRSTPAPPAARPVGAQMIKRRGKDKL